MENRRETFFNAWNDPKNNIFRMKAGDGGTYIVLYMFIPVIVTFVSLKILGNTNVISIAYFYFTVLFSAISCIYDLYSRHDFGISTRRNTKMVFVAIPCVIIAVYSILEILTILISHECTFRFDWIFYFYFFSFAITFWDLVLCYSHIAIFHGFISEYVAEKEQNDDANGGEGK